MTMRVTYEIADNTFSYSLDLNRDSYKLNTLLSNPRGDFLNFNLGEPCSKYQGFSIFDSKALESYKIIDQFVLRGVTPSEVIVNNYEITRVYESVYTDSIPISDEIKNSEIGEDGHLEYSQTGVLQEVSNEVSIGAVEKMFLGPTGGMVYSISNFDGSFMIDLDCRKQQDYDEWGRNYETYEKDGIYFVKYTKKKGEEDEYTLFMGIKTPNFLYDEMKNFHEKDYPYSKERNSLSKWHVFRLMRVHVSGSKRLFIGAGFEEKDVVDQIFLLENHYDELEGFGKSLNKDLVPDVEFALPVTQDIKVAYDMSRYAMYAFLNKELYNQTRSQGTFAGFPWFTQIWSRDELIGLRAFINMGEDQLVKDILMNYLSLIDEETGLLPRLSSHGSFDSADACFILAKRIEDFLFELSGDNRLDQVLSIGEIEYIYDKLSLVFNRIVTTSWNYERELLDVKPGDSWMDTLDTKHPLDVQAQFLCFTSVLAVLSNLLHIDTDTQRLLDLEDLFRSKIVKTYFKDGILSNDPDRVVSTTNVFLSYYFYPSLLTQSEWRVALGNAVKDLKTSWGGFSTLSKNDPEFQPNYTGENDLSYHRGDSWFWMNNIVAIVLHDFSEKEFREEINAIVKSSVEDILKRGTLGFGSEVSSSSEMRPEGAMAQLWTSSTFIEMIDKLHLRQ